MVKASLLSVAVVAALAGCGGGSNSNDVSVQMGSFSLGVSDAPANAENVVIAFKKVVLKNDAGTYSFDVASNGAMQQVDLLDFQGAQAKAIVQAQQVPVGNYQMCIYMQNDETANLQGSYVRLDGGAEYGLVTTSNGSCGGSGADDANTGRLFFNKSFTIAAGANNFVAEFNLAKGLLAPHGNKAYWTVKPTAVQMVNTSDIGAIKGTVSAQYMADCEADAGGSVFSHAVYLYPSATALTAMGDFVATDVTGEVAPVAAARVNPVTDSQGQVTGYQYEIGYLVAGSYSLGYSCLAQNDDAELDNNATDEASPFKVFAAGSDVTVTKGQTATSDFNSILP